MGAFEKPRESRSRRKKKNPLPLIIGIVLLLCLAVVLIVVLTTSHEDKTDPTLPTEPPMTYTGVCIDTPAGTLYYPEEWRDTVKIETESDPFRATLFAVLGEKKFHVFTIYFGENGQGHRFGSVLCTNGKRADVWVEVYDDFLAISSITNEEIQTLYSLQERVNDIIEQIYLLPDFEAA